jgi:hypothetical protein
MAQKLNQCCPNIQLIALTSDLLFAHEDVNPYTRGMLIVSTYPLLGMNQNWSWPYSGVSARRQFPSDSTEGVYNAASLLLANHSLVEYGSPFKKYQEGEFPHPVPWLMIVGNGDIWPVGILKEKRQPDYFAGSRLDGLECPTPVRLFPSALLPVSTLIQMCVWDLVCIVLSLLIIVSDKNSSWIPIIAPSLFGNSVIRTTAMSRNFAASSISAFLFVPSPLFTVVLGKLLRGADFGERVFPTVEYSQVIFVPAYAVLLLSAGAALLALRAVMKTVRRLCWGIGTPADLAIGPEGQVDPNAVTLSPLQHSRGFRVSSLLAFVAAAMAFVSPAFAMMGHHGLILQGFFAMVRGLNFSSGVSPLRPALLASAATLVLFIDFLYSQSFMQQRPIRPHKGDRALFLDFDTTSFKGVSTLERRITTQWVTPFFLTEYLWSVIIFSLFLGVGYLTTTLLAPFQHWFVEPVDGFGFELAFLVLAMFFYLFLSITFMRLITTWRETKKLLRYLYRHPSRTFYPELRKSLPGDENSVVNLFSRQPNTAMASVSYACLLNLLALAEEAKDITATSEPIPRKDANLFNNLGREFDNLSAAFARLQEVRGPAITPLYNLQGSTVDSVEEWKKTIENIYASKLAMLQAAQSATRIAEQAWGLDWEYPDTATKAEKAGGRILRECGLLVTSRAGDFIRNLLPLLHTYTVMGTVGTMVMLLAISSYPFPHEDTLLCFNWVAISAAVGITLWVFFSINRDNVLSLISGTTPGSLNWNAGFLGQLLVHGLIPILLLLGVQFPSSISNALSSIGGLFGKGG